MVVPKIWPVILGSFLSLAFLAGCDRSPSASGPEPPRATSQPEPTSTPDTDHDAATERPAAIRSLEQTTATAEPTLVGRQVCKECHVENFRLHARHGHAATFGEVADTGIANRFAGRTFDAGPDYGVYHYHTDSDGRLYATLPEKFGEQPFLLQYALGSGHNAVTLLTLLPDDRGQTAAIEHRVSWYKHSGELGITVGHHANKPSNPTELFGDSASGEPLQRCIYCHTTSAKIAEDRAFDLVASVNCEKCHGPGSEHVRQARASKQPPPFSIGRSDWDVESEIQLCGDCHRLPRSVTEKELREYPDLLTRFQPIGMLRSACYLKSDRQLKCTTCHNPHRSITEVSASQHIDNCIGCHQPTQTEHVTCPVSTTDGCIDCHMPAIEQTGSGLKFHDHWIRVRED